MDVQAVVYLTCAGIAFVVAAWLHRHETTGEATMAGFLAAFFLPFIVLGAVLWGIPFLFVRALQSFSGEE